jgi:hypothetical protein
MADVPKCRNPKCPRADQGGAPMLVLEEDEYRWVLACRECRDATQQLSVQVLTKPKGWARAREENRMRHVQQMSIQEAQKYRVKRIAMSGGPRR